MESENIEEVIQEGGTTIDGSVTLQNTTGFSGQTLDTATLASRRLATRMRNFNLPNLASPIGAQITYLDRPLLLSDLASLMTIKPTNIQARPDIQNLFDSIPLAQYKHLPDPSYLLVDPTSGGGNIEESTLDTQEVSLPSEASEEDLPSLDIVEPSSTGGSYKRSSHKKRKSTRSRTKKNKKL
jgi:hypothetical protein